jgi:hypothetical protein
VGSVTLEEVRAVAASVLGAGPWSLVVLGPALDTDVSSFVGAAA